MAIILNTNIANLMLGTTQVIKVFLGTAQIWAAEVVVVLSASVSNITLKTLFENARPGLWADARWKKRLVVQAGVEIGATLASHAILITVQADGQAGSWAGTLTLDIYGTVSGIGGTANSGVGGNALNVNFPGRTGQKVIVINYGTIRAGGGGGGRGGNGGAGQVPYTYTEGPSFVQWTYYWNYGSNLSWAGTQYVTGGTTYSAGGWNYTRSTYQYSTYYSVSRSQTRYNPTVGGIAGNAGRGQGFDGAATTGAAVAGGTNAGASGKSGDGGAYGNTGQTGASGAAGNVGAGTAGLAGGLAGYWLTGSANATVNNLGTTRGRLI